MTTIETIKLPNKVTLATRRTPGIVPISQRLFRRAWRYQGVAKIQKMRSHPLSPSNGNDTNNHAPESLGKFKTLQKNLIRTPAWRPGQIPLHRNTRQRMTDDNLPNGCDTAKNNRHSSFRFSEAARGATIQQRSNEEDPATQGS